MNPLMNRGLDNKQYWKSRGESSVLYHLIFISVIAGYSFFLFYNQVFNSSSYQSDLFFHVSLTEYWFGKNNIVLPEFGLQSTLYHLSRLTNISYWTLAPIVLCLAYVVNALLIQFSIRRLTNIKLAFTYILTLALLLLSSIYIPLQHEHFYTGSGTANPWHNPTTVLMKPFALLTVIATLTYFREEKFKYAALASFTLFAATFYKPSFAIAFIPALAIYGILFRREKINTYWAASLVVLPTLMLLAHQYQLLTSPDYPTRQDHIIFAPFAVLHCYTHHIFISFLRGLAYPLSVLILNWNLAKKDNTLRFAWIICGVGYFYFALLAQSGKSLSYGNFGWSYQVGLFILFIFSAVNMMHSYHTLKASREGFIRLSIISVIFMLHVSTGIFYFLRFIFPHSIH